VLWQPSLEIPSGHVDPGQTPEQAARAELLEETGHEANKLEFLANVSPDTGRLSNRLWCFFAGNVVPTRDPAHQVEAGIDFIRYGGSIRELAESAEFCSALHHAALFAAVLRGKLKI
jgi:ADP-ribose pyrophosphatase